MRTFVPTPAGQHRQDRPWGSRGEGTGSQRSPDEAGTDHPVLQEEPPTHLLFLGEGRVQERRGVPVSVSTFAPTVD